MKFVNRYLYVHIIFTVPAHTCNYFEAVEAAEVLAHTLKVCVKGVH